MRRPREGTNKSRPGFPDVRPRHHPPSPITVTISYLEGVYK